MPPDSLAPDFHNLLTYVAEHWESHGRETGWYKEISRSIQEDFIPGAADAMRENRQFDLGEVKALTFPWVSFGSINSEHLFGLNEIILFSFYWSNRENYRSFLDLGANIGLHSVIALKLGLEVTAVEPDPNHLNFLHANLESTKVPNYRVVEGAATVKPGRVSFTRVEGNTTGSHISGAKQNPYGDLTKFEVDGFPVTELVDGKDLVKMDVEGLEADLLQSLLSSGFKGYDVVAEIGSESSAHRIWQSAKASEVNIFSQKVGWSIAEDKSELPHHHSEGSVLLSHRDEVYWL